MRDDPIQECHILSHSQYVDKKIALTIPFPTPLGIPIELSFNKNGNVIMVNYCREKEPKKRR